MKVLIKFPEQTEIKYFECPPFVEKIGYEAFYQVSSIVEITIPETVQEIDERAFYDCRIETIRILNTKIKIGKEAFRWCSSTMIWYIPKHASQSFESKISKTIWNKSELIREELETKFSLSKESIEFENEIIELAINNCGYAFANLKPSYKKNIEFLKKALKTTNGSIFKYAHHSLRSDKNIIDELVNLHGGILPYAKGYDYMSDREYILKSSRSYFGIIKDIENKSFREKISMDEEIVLNTLQHKVDRGIFAPLQFVHEKLRGNRDVVLNATKVSGFNFSYADSKFMCDREIVLHAVKTAGYLLNKVCHELKDDEEIVKIAIKRNGENIKYASERIKGIKEIALCAIETYGRAFEYLSDELKNDKDIILPAVKQEGIGVISFTSAERYCADKDVTEANEIFKIREKEINDSKLDYTTSKNLTQNREFVLNAVSKDGMSLQYASLKLKKDREIIRTAISNNGYAYKFACLE